MELPRLILKPESFLLMPNEDDWMIIVAYCAASWLVVITVSGTHTDLCGTVV